MGASRPTLIGHRGLGRGVVDGHPQNTLGSFLAALDAGVSWVEVDVRRTADDVLVVAHDAAYGDGAFLVDLTAEQVRERGTLELSTLLAALPEGAGVSLDLKTCMEDAVRPPERTTAALLAPVAEQELRRRPLWVPLGLLTWHGYPTEHAVAAAAHLDVQVLALQVGSLWPETAPEPIPDPVPRASRRPLQHVLTLLHRSGRQLAVWCPRLQHARQLVTAGVDALIIDDVPRTAPALRGAT
jgi:glycerophosphoryl diester phosphodiesterase